MTVPLTLLAAAQSGYRDPVASGDLTERARRAHAIGAWMNSTGRTCPRHVAAIQAGLYEVNDLTVSIRRAGSAFEIRRET